MTTENSTGRRDLMERLFWEHFQNTPSLWCRAPGRVDLMGSHTDYNLGLVLTLPIGHDTWVAASPRADRVVRVYSVNLDQESSFDLDRLTPDPQCRWSNYLRGVARILQGEGLALKGCDVALHSTVPMSSGLSSSAALECATATLFEALGGWKLEPVRKALLCQKAENEFVGVNCGILDQYTSCLGKEGCALLLDCLDLSSQPIQLPPALQVVICDTRSKRELAGSEYGKRRAQCEEGARRLGLKALREISPETFYRRESELPEEMARRCRFIVEEHDRVQKLAKALEACDQSTIRRLCADSFRGACELYEISAPPMLAMMRSMLAAPGVVGARQAGAGFGGCMVAFVEKTALQEFSVAVRRDYATATQIPPEVYPVEASEGAGLI